MLSIIFKLLSIFGVTPWLERFLNIGFDTKILDNISGALKNITGVSDTEKAIELIQNNRVFELELKRMLLIAETNYWKECIKDKQNARERDLMIQNMRGKNIRANIMLIMAMLGILITFGGVLVFKASLNAEGVAMLSALAAVFGSCLKDVYSFEFGSSKAILNDKLKDK
jgi:hypothetical protein